MSEYIFAFVFMALVDLLYAKYTIYVGKQKAVSASTMAALILLFNTTVVVGVVHNFAVIIPAALGAFVGTYIGVRK